MPQDDERAVITRRTFLKAASSATAAWLVTPALAQAQGPTVSGPSTVGTNTMQQGNPDDPTTFNHRFFDVNGVRVHAVVEGQGPLVLLLHGFPYLWYSWRRQIRALAEGGYRVVAPDFCGFGQSDCPPDVQSYDVFHTVADLVGLMHALQEKTAVIVGHDLGSWVANAAVQLRPDLFRALVMLNSPIGPREALEPSESWKAVRAATGKRFYHDYFQTPGEADPVMNADIRKTLRSVYFSVSGSAVGSERWRPLIGSGETVLDTVTDPKKFPSWLSPMALDYYVTEYSRNGFTPPLNYYRNRDHNWKETAFMKGMRPEQPTMFIGGVDDPSAEFFMPTYEHLESFFPNLRSKTLLKGVGHDAAEERPDVVSSMLLDFLKKL